MFSFGFMDGMLSVGQFLKYKRQFVSGKCLSNNEQETSK